MSKPVLGLLAGLAIVSTVPFFQRSRGSLALGAVERLRAALEATSGSANRTGSLAARKKKVAQDSVPSPAQALAQTPAHDVVVSQMLRIDPKDVPDELLLAVLLMGAVNGDPVKAARDAIGDVEGNLHRVLRAQAFDTRGLTSLAKARMSATRELVRRANLRGTLEGTGPVIDDPNKAVDLARVLSAGRRERFTAIYMDSARRVLATRELSTGSTKFTLVDPTEVFRPAIEFSARSIIVVHNHPSGKAKPSREDEQVTQKLISGGKVLGIPVEDHLIVTPVAHYSFRSEQPHLYY